MVYKRYIKRGGKLYGPYYYESYRDENGKVISKFIPDYKPEPKSHKKRNFLLIFGIFFGIFAVFLLFQIPNNDFSVSTFSNSLFKMTGSIYNSLTRLIGLSVSEEPISESSSETTISETLSEKSDEKSDKKDKKEKEKDSKKDETTTEDETTSEEESNPEQTENTTEQSQELEIPEINATELIEKPETEDNETEIIEIPENETQSESNITEIQEPIEEIPIENPVIPEINITEPINEINISEISEIPEENISEIEIPIENLTEINQTEILNETIILIENITEIQNETGFNLTTEKYRIVIGRPVRWIKKIEIQNNSIEELKIELPKQAENISIKTGDEAQQAFEEINSYQNEIENADKEDILNNGITGAVASEENNNFAKKLLSNLANLFKKLFITGKAISENEIEITETDDSKIIDVADEVDISSETEIAVEYFTEAPQSAEKTTSSGKIITISGPDNIYYTDILAYTEIQAQVPETAIKLYHILNNSKENIEIGKYDLNSDGFIEYIEWVVPHLSEQEYELEITILNVQSYPTVGGNWTVNFTTIGTANLTITAFNGTTWSNNSEEFSLYDLKFLEIKCNENILNYQWIENEGNYSIFIPDYSCNGTASETSKVLTEGSHYLEFDFGGIKAIARNWAYAPQSDGFSTAIFGSEQPNGITTNNSDFWIVDSIDDFVYHTDALGNNQTDGFSIAIIGCNDPWDITTNGSDFWIVDPTDDFVYHTDALGNNQSDGFKTKSTLGSGSPVGITTNGSDFWIVDNSDDFVYHTDALGNNQTDGFKTSVLREFSDPYGITTNNSDFWIIDESSDFVYHTDALGNNQSDGFSTLTFGGYDSRGITTNGSDFWIADYINDFVYHITRYQDELTECGTLSTENGVYNLQNDISDVISCFTIAAHNITLNLNGHTITANTSSSGGVASDNYNYLNVLNGTFQNFSRGVCIGTTINSSFTDLNFYNNSADGISLYSSENVIITNITLNGNSRGISLDTNSNITVTNVTGENNQYAIFIGGGTPNANNTILKNIFTKNNSFNGIKIAKNSVNTTLENIISINDSSCCSYGSIQIDTSYSIFINNTFIFNSSNYGLYIINSSNNTFRDIVINNSVSKDVVLRTTQAGDLAINNTLVNVSYSTVYTEIGAFGGNMELIRKWYYRAYVNDSVTGLIIQGANITAFNRTSNYNFNLTTDAAGYTPVTEIIEYILNSTTISPTITYFSNYTIYAVNDGYPTIYKYYNATSSRNNLEHVISLDSVNPDINITFPINNTNLSDINLDINYTYSDANPELCWYSNDTFLANASLANCGTNITSIILSEGQHNITVWINDTSGNINFSSVRFYIDSTAPIINISFPLNQTYTNRTLNFNVSADELIIDWWLSNNTGYTNTSFTPNQTYLWNEGSNTLYVWANDSFGNKGEANVTFLIDSINPDISIVFPSNNSNSSDINFDINYTASDSGVGLSKCWFSNDTMEKNTTLATCGTNITTMIWVEGQHNITIWANDTAGNENKSSVRFTIDLTKPTICGTLDKVDTIYTLQNNITTDETCFIIAANNITLHMNGYNITGDGDIGVSVNGYNNLAVYNGTIDNFGNSIKLDNSNYAYINNMSFIRSTYGIYPTGGSYSGRFTNLNFDQDSFAIALGDSDNNYFENITVISAAEGIDATFGSSNNNIFNNFTITSSGSISAIIVSGNNNSFYNLTGNSNPVDILFISSTNCSLNGFNSNGSIGSSLGSISLIEATDTNIKNILINDSDKYGIYIGKYAGAVNTPINSNNTFTNIFINNTDDKDIYFETDNSGSQALNNTFVNATFNSSDVGFNNNTDGGEIELIRKWYYRAYVNDSITGSAIQNANITAFNKTSNYNFNLTTDAAGYTPTTEIIDYITKASATGTTTTYYSNYTIYAANDSYPTISKNYNVTLNQNNLEHVLSLDNIAPTISYSCSPSSVETGATVTCSCTATDSGSGVNTGLTAYTANPSTATAGTFSVTCSATDLAGNSGTASTSYTVTSPTTGTPPTTPPEVCTPNCDGIECGPNSCNAGSCGSCGEGEICQSGNCVSGCADECSSGAQERQCSDLFAVSTRTCGNYDSDSCSEWSDYSYESCPSGCQNGNCRILTNETCPDTCSSLGYKCGTWLFCNKEVSCGDCSWSQTCNSGICSCTENWKCDWSDCIKEGENYYSSPINCEDLNSCGAEKGKPEKLSCEYNNETGELIPVTAEGKEACLPKWDCSEWPECHVSYGLEDVVEGKTSLQGLQARSCIDSKKCQPEKIERRKCNTKIPITAEAVAECSRNYLEIYNTNHTLISKLELVQGDSKKLNVQFALSGKNYCPYCFDGIKNYDEDQIDCNNLPGRSCPICEVKQIIKPSKNNFFMLLIFLILNILTLLVLIWYILLSRKKKKHEHFIPIKKEKEAEKQLEQKIERDIKNIFRHGFFSKLRNKINNAIYNFKHRRYYPKEKNIQEEIPKKKINLYKRAIFLRNLSHFFLNIKRKLKYDEVRLINKTSEDLTNFKKEAIHEEKKLHRNISGFFSRLKRKISESIYRLKRRHEYKEKIDAEKAVHLKKIFYQKSYYNKIKRREKLLEIKHDISENLRKIKFGISHKLNNLKREILLKSGNVYEREEKISPKISYKFSKLKRIFTRPKIDVNDRKTLMKNYGEIKNILEKKLDSDLKKSNIPSAEPQQKIYYPLEHIKIKPEESFFEKLKRKFTKQKLDVNERKTLMKDSDKIKKIFEKRLVSDFEKSRKEDEYN